MFKTTHQLVYSFNAKPTGVRKFNRYQKVTIFKIYHYNWYIASIITSF